MAAFINNYCRVLNLTSRFSQAIKLSRYAVRLAKESSRLTRSLPQISIQLTEFEKNIPLLKNSVWLYMSYIPFFFVAVYFMKDRALFDRGLAAMKTLTEMNNDYFRKYPMTYTFDRKKENPLTWRKPSDWLFRYAYTFDTGNNAFPSQHVSLSAFCGLELLHAGYKQIGNFLLFWTVLIAATTLTTKQHFQIDVVSALLLASKVHQRYFMSKNPVPVSHEASEACKAEIRNEIEDILHRLMSSDFSQNLSPHVDPAILETMEAAQDLKWLNPIYPEIIKNTLTMIRGE